VCTPDERPQYRSALRLIFLLSDALCAKCSINEPFEQHLENAAKDADVPVIHVLPDRANQTSLYTEMRSRGKDVLRINLRAFGITRTPAAIAVNHDGHIQAVYTGTVPSTLQNRAVHDLIEGKTEPLYARTDMKAVRAGGLPPNSQFIILLDHHADAGFKGNTFNIPISELGLRAQYELDRAKPTFIDCSAGGIWPYICQDELLLLHSLGFKHLTAVNLPFRQGSDFCDTPKALVFR